MISHPRNHAQLLFVIPVSKYRHVVTPINGINEYRFINVSTLNRIQILQNMTMEIFGVARSMKEISPERYSAFVEKSKFSESLK